MTSEHLTVEVVGRYWQQKEALALPHPWHYTTADTTRSTTRQITQYQLSWPSGHLNWHQTSFLYKSQGCPDTLAALHLRPMWQHFTILSSCGNECVLIWLIPDTDHVYHQLPSVTLTLLQSLVSCIPSGSHEGSGSLGYFYTFIGVGGNKQQKPDPAHTERKMINFIAVFLTSAVNYF